METAFPVHAVISAKEKRQIPVKHYVFIIDVRWSDGSRIPIYRQYSHFAQLHTDLCDVVGASSISVTKLPEFPQKKVFQRRENSKNASMRRHAFDDYMHSLLQLEPDVSQNPKIVQFFKARVTDINPPNESPKEEPSKRSSIFTAISGLLHSNKSDENMPEDENDPIYVSSPIICQTYVALADYAPEEKGEMKLKESMTVEVVEKYDNGWWFVQTEYGFGWAPATYLKPQGCSDDQEEEPEPIYSGHKYLSTEQYNAVEADEVSFPEGVLVKVLHKLLDGWWIIEYKGVIGYVPAAYLVSFKNPHYKESRKHSRKPTKRRKTIKNSKGSSFDQKPRDLSIYYKMSKKLSKEEAAAVTESLELKLKEIAERKTAQTSTGVATNVSHSDDGVYSPTKKHEYEYIDEDEMDDIDEWVDTKFNAEVLNKSQPSQSQKSVLKGGEGSIDHGPGLTHAKNPVTSTLVPGMKYVKSPSVSMLSRANLQPQISSHSLENSQNGETFPETTIYNSTTENKLNKDESEDDEPVYDTAAPGMVYAKAPTYKVVPKLPSHFVDSVEEDEPTDQQTNILPLFPSTAKESPSKSHLPLYSYPLKKNVSNKDNACEVEDKTINNSSLTSNSKPESVSENMDAKDAMKTLIQSLQNRSISSIRTNDSGEMVIKFSDNQ